MRRFDTTALVQAALLKGIPEPRDSLVRSVILNAIRRPPSEPPRRGFSQDGVPTDPRRPSPHSGDAAAALTFDL